MEAQRDRARAASNFAVVDTGGIEIDGCTTFTGYDSLNDKAQVTALFHDGEKVDVLKGGEEGIVVLDHTPFYAESGGQIGDRGQCRQF